MIIYCAIQLTISRRSAIMDNIYLRLDGTEYFHRWTSKKNCRGSGRGGGREGGSTVALGLVVCSIGSDYYGRQRRSLYEEPRGDLSQRSVEQLARTLLCAGVGYWHCLAPVRSRTLKLRHDHLGGIGFVGGDGVVSVRGR